MYEYDLTNEELPFIEAGQLPDKGASREESQLTVEPQQLPDDEPISDLDRIKSQITPRVIEKVTAHAELSQDYVLNLT